MDDVTNQQQSDEDLLHLASTTFGTAQCREAFDIFVTRQRTFAVNFAYSYVRTAHGAEDMAQEAFIRLYESLPRYESKAPARALLATIIRNVCLTSLKRDKKVVVSDEAQQIAEETLVAREAAHDASSDVPEAERVLRIIETLSHAQGEAIRLRYFHGLTYDEIGAAMGITRNHAGVLLHQALARVRQRMGRGP